MLAKELSITTVLVSLLYYSAYSFNAGIADFFGYPRVFISIGLSEVIKSAAGMIAILFCFSALLHLIYKSEDYDGKNWFIAIVVGVAISIGTALFVGTPGYFRERNVMEIISYAALLGAGAVTGIGAVKIAAINDFKGIKLTHVVVIVFSVLTVPSSAGWLSKYFFKDELYYSVSDKAYILESYGQNYVLGSCGKNVSKFFLKDKIEGEIRRVSNEDSQQVKVCFTKAK